MFHVKNFETEMTQEQWKIILDASPTPQVVLTKNLNIELINHAFKELLGHQSKNNFIEHINSEDEAEFEFFISDLIEGKTKPYQELIFDCDHMAGNIITVSISGTTVSIDDDLRLILSLRDITEEIELRERLHRNEKDLERVIESTNDGYWDWKMQEDHEYMSPRFWEMLGYDFKTKKHHPSEWLKIIFEEDLPLVIKNIEQHIESKGEVPFIVEVRYRHADGSTVWVICRGKVIEWGEEGEPVRMIGCHTDITKLKHVQGVLEINSKMAALGQMAGEIAHEINNPLTILNLNIERCRMLLKDHENPKVFQILETSQNTIGRVGEIVKSLKKVSHGVQEAYEEADLKDVIHDAINVCYEKSRREGIPVNFNSEENSFLLNCHRVEISQVLINLISNSIYALRGLKERWIKINLKSQESKTVIEVTDSGDGIPEDVQKNMMDPFFTTKPVGEGTGFGLSISQAIMKRHNGELNYVSDSKYTTFQLVFHEDSNQGED